MRESDATDRKRVDPAHLIPGHFSHWVTIMKTLLNNLRVHIGYEDNGHLVHTDKGTGAQKISRKTWFNVESARNAVAKDLGKIEWDALKEPPPAA